MFKSENVPWNKGKKYKTGKPSWNTGLKTGKPAWNTGKKLSEEHRLKVIKTLSSQNQLGDKNLQWKGGKIINGNGYVMVKNYTHPIRTNNNYYPEHRLIMEEHIGRILSRKENVHHINGIKTDNRIENLLLISNSEHIRNHRKAEVNKGIFRSIRPNFKSKKVVS